MFYFYFIGAHIAGTAVAYLHAVFTWQVIGGRHHIGSHPVSFAQLSIVAIPRISIGTRRGSSKGKAL